MLTETGLVRKAQKGDGDAFVQLVKKYETVLYGVARRYLDTEDAADALQDTMLTGFKKIHGLRQSKYFYSWITKILINECYKILKKKNEFSLQKLDYRSESIFNENNENEKLDDLITELNPIYRTPLLLYYYNGFSYKEISTIIDEPLGTVKSRISRGKALLRKEYLKGE